jgi:hypothetical protein
MSADVALGPASVGLFRVFVAACIERRP